MNLAFLGSSDDGLFARLTAAAKRGPTKQEIRAQKVSFIVSAVSDEKTKITKQDVEAELAKLNGESI